jgi:putative pyoverdin transport system ATP-binding/permease protein
MSLLRFLMRYSRKTVILAVVAGAISGACNTGLLAVINSALASTSRISLVWAFIGLCAVVPTARITSELLLLYLGQGTVLDLRLRLSRRILGISLSRLEELGPHRLLAILTDDIPQITGMVTLIPILCINFSILIGCLVYLGYLSLPVLGAVVGLIVLGILTYQVPVSRANVHFRRARDFADHLFDHFRALTDGAKELKLNRDRREAFLTRVLENTAQSVKSSNLRGFKVYTLASSWGQLLVFIIIGLVIFALPLFFATNRETLTGYALVLLYLMTPLQVAMNNLPAVARANVAVKRVETLGAELVSYASEEPEVPRSRPDREWSSIELSGVTHVYQREGDEAPFVLGPIDLTLRPGELIFLAGGNGSGKTTLAKVLTGLYPAHEGEIRFNGQPVTDDNRETYRQQFSAVFSDFYLFDELLGLEAPDVDAQARQQLARLELDKKVEVEDGKLSTIDLSQGQRKRLALLTAYLEDRPIYLFDEWAADQDPHFRGIFYNQLLPELRDLGKCVLVISHDDRYYHLGDRLIKLVYGKIDEEASGPLAQEAVG